MSSDDPLAFVCDLTDQINLQVRDYEHHTTSVPNHQSLNNGIVTGLSRRALHHHFEMLQLSEPQRV